jgi:DNA-binding transcriptional MerR regulator
MRISQLSERAGLPVGTVKFYLRTGLLHHGRATSATQAVYDEKHLERLRLIRALLEVGRLSHAEIQRILDATSDGESGIDEAHRSTAPHAEGDDQLDLGAARAVVAGLGWTVADDSPHIVHLARALKAVQSVDLPASPERIGVYADAAALVARNDMQCVAEVPPEEQPRVAATRAVLFEQVLSALRSLAFESQAAGSPGVVPGPRRSPAEEPATN